MITKNDKEEWFSFLEAEIEGEKAKQYLKDFVKTCLLKDIPIIFENRHLSLLLGIRHDIILSITSRSFSYYYDFEIPKRKGGNRSISAPYPALLFIQHWINKNILNKVDLGSHSYAYRKNRSIVDHAKIHVGKHSLLKLDLKDFFPSISLRRVISVFQQFGYSNKISYTLSQLCCLQGCLPQGAATSPVLSNIIAKRLDKRLYGLGQKYKITYSRYADDLAFSGDYISLKFQKIVKKIIIEERFELNEAKSQLIQGFSKRKILTGISISGSNLRLPKKTKRQLRKEVHYLLKNGIKEHSMHLSYPDPIYTERLLGKLYFWKMIENENDFVNKTIESLKAYQKELDSLCT